MSFPLKAHFTLQDSELQKGLDIKHANISQASVLISDCAFDNSHSREQAPICLRFLDFVCNPQKTVGMRKLCLKWFSVYPAYHAMGYLFAVSHLSVSYITELCSANTFTLR